MFDIFKDDLLYILFIDPDAAIMHPGLFTIISCQWAFENGVEDAFQYPQPYELQPAPVVRYP